MFFLNDFLYPLAIIGALVVLLFIAVFFVFFIFFSYWIFLSIKEKIEKLLN